ncbi:MAG: Digeranylgeranylglycerophospholipid reductase [Methanomassiliicoccales archaeon PtaU1.Bin124]|nr:MAG: Digeranylgeranylglycerophospholipid reductase [Methanomassiliicoccales archaeon PtaU1.Bin124]
MVEHIKTDVVIIGAGPAGSSTAEHAALNGANVVVLERRPVIGEPVRCGEFMPSLAEIRAIFPKALDIDPVFDMPQDLHSLETTHIRIYSPSLRTWDVPFSGYTTDRNRFDQHLAKKAERAGASIITGVQAKRVREGLVIADGLEVEAKVVVGADGPLSLVGKSLGYERSSDLCPAVTVQVKGDFEPVSEMYFGSVAPGGYAWIIPKKGGANIGLGVANRFARMTVNEYFRKFLEFKGIKPEMDISGKFVPMSGPIHHATKEHSLLVGDAAGQVMAVNGGGIPISMMTGRLAGRAVAMHVKNGAPLSDYEVMCRQQIYKPLYTAVHTKWLANTCFGSKWRLEQAMRFLGQRRINKLIRCKPVLP